ncbi:MAG: VWA domain-containing protein [Proteobacteria bacterium]|nr:VWA domain-containing protein [Pseudomonadota bacterium]
MPGNLSKKNVGTHPVVTEHVSLPEAKTARLSDNVGGERDDYIGNKLQESNEKIAVAPSSTPPKDRTEEPRFRKEGAYAGPAPAETLADKKQVLVAKGKTSQLIGGLAPSKKDMDAMAPAQVMTRSFVTPGIMAESEAVIMGPVYAGRDRFDHTEINPIKLVGEAPVSTFSIDVDTAAYAFVRRALNNGHLPQKDAVRVEEMINYFDYNYDIPKDRANPFKPTVALYQTPWNPQTQLLHIGIKGHDIVKEARPKTNLVFLIDVSGSMSSQDKLPLLKNSMKMLVEELQPEDRVAIAVYAGAAGTVLEPTKAAEKGKIIAALDKLNAGGSTAGGAGIKLAYALAEANFQKDAVNRVILATDGDFNVGIRNPEELKGFVERKKKSGIYLSVLGFGQGNYNDALMQKLAQNGNGNAAYIDTLSEARKVLVEEASSTLFTIAKDVKIQVEFNPASVAEYRLIGYESRMLKREDFNNDQVDAGDVGAGHTVTAIYEITTVESKSKFIDDLRYADSKTTQEKGKKGEYAFLKIRYKLPHEEVSRLLTKPIDEEAMVNNINNASEDIRFAASVAAFGQILRGTPYTKNFDYDDVIKLAEPAKGRDQFGYRSEFLNMVRLAKTASTMGDR